MNARPERVPTVFLSGFMGAGKSTVGAALAGARGAPFVDLDGVTEALLGESIADAIRRRGEEAFREVERRALARAAGVRGGVVALGGGTLLAPENRALVRTVGVVVWLRVSEATAASRIGNGTDRPLFRPGLLAERESVYAEADFNVETDGWSVNEIVRAILTWLEGRRP